MLRSSVSSLWVDGPVGDLVRQAMITLWEANPLLTAKIASFDLHHRGRRARTVRTNDFCHLLQMERSNVTGVIFEIHLDGQTTGVTHSSGSLLLPALSGVSRRLLPIVV